MRANGREVDQNRFDGCNSGVHTCNDEVDGLPKYCARNIRLSKTIDV